MLSYRGCDLAKRTCQACKTCAHGALGEQTWLCSWHVVELGVGLTVAALGGIRGYVRGR